MRSILATISVALYVTAYAPYLWMLFHRRIRPAAVSWLMWGTLGVVSATVILGQGGGVGAIQPFATTAVCLLIGVVAVWHRRGTEEPFWSQSPSWTYVIWLATVSVYAAYCALWFNGFTGSVMAANLSITIYLVAEACGLPATIRGTWDDPWRESLWMWVFATASQAVNIFALENRAYATLAPSLAWTVFNLTVVIPIIVRRAHLKKNTLSVGVKPRTGATHTVSHVKGVAPCRPRNSVPRERNHCGQGI